MSGTSKTLGGAAVVLVLIILGVWYAGHTAPPAASPVSMATSTQALPPSGNVVTNASDSSDASISADLSNVDGELSAMSSDNASVDSSLSDKSVQ
jgi:hypothetical protein